MFKLAGMKLLPSLVALELVSSRQNMAERASRFKVQKTLHLKANGNKAVSARELLLQRQRNRKREWGVPQKRQQGGIQTHW